jgi:aromatic ring hydroxylase
MGRLPDYVPLILTGLYDQRDHLAASNPQFARNVEEYFDYCLQADLCLSHSFADPQIDRSKPSGQVNYLRIVRKDKDGVVIRGAKTIATLAPYANEYLILTPPRAGIVPEQLILFATPVATRGLRFICREPFSQSDSFDHPLSSRFDEMDAWAIFDDVRVPSERIFLMEDISVIRKIWKTLNVWAYYHLLIRMAVKAELFVGVSSLISEYISTVQFQNVQEELAELIRYLETLRSFIRASEVEGVTTRAALFMPCPQTIMVGHMYAIEHYPRVVNTLVNLSGQSILMAPGRVDFESDELRSQLEPYLADAQSSTEAKMRVFKLAWDLTCSSFAGRQLLFEIFNARNLTKNRLDFLRFYDTSHYKDAALQLAGVSIEQPGTGRPSRG